MKHLLYLLLIPFCVFAQMRIPVTILNSGCFIYKEPSITSSKLFDDVETKNKEIILLSKHDNFFRIKVEDKIGYILSVNIPTDKKNQFYEESLRFNDIKFSNIQHQINLKHKAENISTFIDSFIQPENKSEFETTQDFEKRTTFDSSKIFIFEINLNGADNTPSYNADDKTYRIRLPFENSLLKGWRILVHSSTKYLGSYTGTNAFGVKKSISQYKTEEYQLASLNDSWNFTDNKLNPMPESINLYTPKEIAQKVKNDFVLRIGISFMSKKDKAIEYDSIEPTISDPRELTFKKTILSGLIRYLYLYNKKEPNINKLFLPEF